MLTNLDIALFPLLLSVCADPLDTTVDPAAAQAALKEIPSSSLPPPCAEGEPFRLSSLAPTVADADDPYSLLTVTLTGSADTAGVCEVTCENNVAASCWLSSSTDCADRVSTPATFTAARPELVACARAAPNMIPLDNRLLVYHGIFGSPLGFPLQHGSTP